MSKKSKKKDKAKKTPVYEVIAAGDIRDRYSEYPSEGLTPGKLAQIFHAAVEGDIRAQMELFEDMEEKDPHLFSQMQTRKLAVTGLDWEVQPFSDDERDKQVAEFVSDELKSMEDLPEAMLDMLDAIGKGVSIMEIGWNYRDGHNAIESLTYVHPKKLAWDPVTDEMLVCTEEHPNGVPLPENKFVIHKYKARSGHVSRAGLFRVVAWFYMFKNFNIKDWVSFCELFGMPLRLGKYGAAASEKDKQELERALVRLGTDAAGIVPDSTQIEFIEANKTSSSDGYEKFSRYLDEQVSKAVLGQTLTSDSGGGSYAQSKTHNEVRHDLTEHDAKSLAATIRKYIITPLVEYNFGEGTEIPFFTFDVSEAEDLTALSGVYRTLAVDMGVKIPADHIYKKFNIPKPEDGEEVLVPPQTGQAAPLGIRMPDTGQTDPEEEAEPDAQKETGLQGKPEQQKEQELPEELKPQKQVEVIANRDEQEPEELRQVDRIAEAAVTASDKIFREMLKPILNIIDKSASLEELSVTLKDEEKLKSLFYEMDSPQFYDLMQQGIYLSSLIGRSMEQ